MTTAVPTARRWPVISALGVVMIFTWGSTYYLMTVLAAPIAADTGWSLGSITGALSAGLLVAGLASPPVGRMIARQGGRPVLAAGCAMIAAGLFVIAAAPALWVFWAGWLILGLGMAAGLYDPAFASLGRLYGQEARGAITLLTLWGGFASTVCWPLSAFMLDLWGWRGVAAAYAAITCLSRCPWSSPRSPGKAAKIGWRDQPGALSRSRGANASSSCSWPRCLSSMG
jgi:MFS family permease